MTDSRYHDPMRRVVERLVEGAGSDLLLMECGHQISKDHRKTWEGRRTRCHGCRVWKDRP
jgi:hypothetical protein